MAVPRVRVQCDFSPELDEWLRAQAMEMGISRNALVVRILTFHKDEDMVPKVSSNRESFP